jgi:hypothetical protein
MQRGHQRHCHAYTVTSQSQRHPIQPFVFHFLADNILVVIGRATRPFAARTPLLKMQIGALRAPAPTHPSFAVLFTLYNCLPARTNKAALVKDRLSQ